MRSKGPFPQTMWQTSPFPIHIWVFDPSGSRQQQPSHVYSSRPGVFAGTPPAQPGRGLPGTTGTGPNWLHRAARSQTPPQKLFRDQHRFVLRQGTNRGRDPLPGLSSCGPDSRCIVFFQRSQGEDLCGISENRGFRPFRIFFFFHPARCLRASGVRPRCLCSAVTVP